MTRKMKDSGIEWIGEIPEDWEVVKLKYLGEFSSSGIDKKINENEKLIKIVNYTDVYNNWQFRLYNMNYMIVSANSDQIKQHLLKRGDLIFTPSSETIEDIGISAVVMEDLINTAFSYHVLRYKFNSSEKVIFEYRRYLCNNNYSYNYFSFLAKGTTRKTLKRSDFKEAKVVLPPLKTQEKISVFLDNKMADTENIKSAIIKEIQTLEDYKKSIITEAVTKGLDKNVEMKDSGIEWIGEIPEHWSISRIKYLTTSRSEKGNLSDTNKYIGLENVESKTGKYIKTDTDYIDAVYDQCKKGDLLYGKLRPNLNKVLISPFDASCTGEFEIIKESTIDKKWLYYYFLTPGFTSIVNSSTFGAKMPRASWTFIENIKIAYPNDSEMQEIISYIDSISNVTDVAICSKQKQLETLEEYKKSLIYEYVTGKKEVKDGEET